MKLQVGRCLIDSGYLPEAVFAAVRRSNRLTVLSPSKGIGIGPDARPFSQYVRRPGEQYGLHWRVPSTRGTRELPTVNIDTNFWKTFCHERLASAAGEVGGLTLFGTSDRQYRLLAEHLCAEYRVRTEGRGRMVDVWKPRVHGFDNHWLDCLVGCAAAASMLGCVLPGAELTDGRRHRPPVKLSALQGSQR